MEGRLGTTVLAGVPSIWEEKELQISDTAASDSHAASGRIITGENHRFLSYIAWGRGWGQGQKAAASSFKDLATSRLWASSGELSAQKMWKDTVSSHAFLWQHFQDYPRQRVLGREPE